MNELNEWGVLLAEDTRIHSSGVLSQFQSVGWSQRDECWPLPVASSRSLLWIPPESLNVNSLSLEFHPHSCLQEGLGRWGSTVSVIGMFHERKPGVRWSLPSPSHPTRLQPLSSNASRPHLGTWAAGAHLVSVEELGMWLAKGAGLAPLPPGTVQTSHLRAQKWCQQGVWAKGLPKSRLQIDSSVSISSLGFRELCSSRPSPPLLFKCISPSDFQAPAHTHTTFSFCTLPHPDL